MNNEIDYIKYLTLLNSGAEKALDFAIEAIIDDAVKRAYEKESSFSGFNGLSFSVVEETQNKPDSYYDMLVIKNLKSNGSNTDLGLSGFLSKVYKKLKKAGKKVGKALKKAVKKVAPIALVAVGMYYGGPYLYSVATKYGSSFLSAASTVLKTKTLADKIKHQKNIDYLTETSSELPLGMTEKDLMLIRQGIVPEGRKVSDVIGFIKQMELISKGMDPTTAYRHFNANKEKYITEYILDKDLHKDAQNVAYQMLMEEGYSIDKSKNLSSAIDAELTMDASENALAIIKDEGGASGIPYIVGGLVVLAAISKR